MTFPLIVFHFRFDVRISKKENLFTMFLRQWFIGWIASLMVVEHLLLLLIACWRVKGCSPRTVEVVEAIWWWEKKVLLLFLVLSMTYCSRKLSSATCPTLLQPKSMLLSVKIAGDTVPAGKNRHVMIVVEFSGGWTAPFLFWGRGGAFEELQNSVSKWFPSFWLLIHQISHSVKLVCSRQIMVI